VKFDQWQFLSSCSLCKTLINIFNTNDWVINQHSHLLLYNGQHKVQTLQLQPVFVEFHKKGGSSSILQTH
jgi:hypothetical protein